MHGQVRKPRFGRFYEAFRRNQTAVKNDYILFNTSFGLANHSLGYDQNILKVKNRLQEEYDEAYVQLRYNHQKQLLQYFIDAIKAIAEQFPNLDCVVRPQEALDDE